MRGHHNDVRPLVRACCSTALVLAISLLVALVALVMPAGTAPAFASCAARSADQMRADADATALGTIVAIEKQHTWFGEQSSGDPVTYWIEVSQVFDGPVHSLIKVASQGYPLDQAAEGHSYLLFLRGESPTFTSDACSSIPTPIAEAEKADAVAGWEWSAPEPGGAELPTAGPPWLAIGIGALVLAMVGVLVRDVRKRSASTSDDTMRA